MKKLIVILLLLGYGLSSFGMTLHIHYCCGKVDTVKLTPTNDHGCGVKDKSKKKGCCDDRQVEFKIKTDYKNEPSAWIKFNSFTESPVIDGSLVVTIDNNPNFGYPQNFSSFPGNAVPLYIKHCIYRI